MAALYCFNQRAFEADDLLIQYPEFNGLLNLLQRLE